MSKLIWLVGGDCREKVQVDRQVGDGKMEVITRSSSLAAKSNCRVLDENKKYFEHSIKINF